MNNIYKQRSIFPQTLRFNPITPIKFYTKETIYVPGKGNITTWEELVCDNYSVFYCEWRGSFGERALSAEAIGIKDSATVRTFYNPVIYEKIRRVQTIVVKNADNSAFIDGEPDKNNPNLYELWGGVDNVKGENQFMEFRVRRYEGL